MSFTHSKFDTCATNQQKDANKSIFNYIVDSSRFINKNECNNYTAPFLTYIPTGVLNFNVDIENDLKGINRHNSKCNDCKFHPSEQELQQIQTEMPNGPLYDKYPNNKKECPKDFNILPNGYIPNTTLPNGFMVRK
mgnify:FL=1